MNFTHTDTETEILDILEENCNRCLISEGFTAMYRESPVAFETLQHIVETENNEVITYGTIYDDFGVDELPMKPVKDALFLFERLGVITSSASSRFICETGDRMYRDLSNSTQNTGAYDTALDFSDFTLAHAVILDLYCGTLKSQTFTFTEMTEELYLTDYADILRPAFDELRDLGILAPVKFDSDDSPSPPHSYVISTDMFRARTLRDAHNNARSHVRAFRFPNRNITPDTRKYY